jgi:hypothetical protein
MAKEYNADEFFTIDSMPFIKEMLENPKYFRYEKRRECNIIHMNPETYFEETAKFHHGDLEREHKMMDDAVIEKYAHAMLNGEKFPIPFLDYTRDGQEGRHRLLAVQYLVDNELIEPTLCPVAIIKDVKLSDEELKQYYFEKHGYWIEV